MKFGLEGKKVRLVPMDLDRHFENAARWINDPDSTEWIATLDQPMTKPKEREWFDARSIAGLEESNWAIETLSGEHIGFSSLFRINHIHKTAESGSMLGDSSYRGKGFGSDAARLRARYAFDSLGMNTLYSSYFEGNEASAMMQKAAGYEIWGVKPSAMWKRGAYRNMIQTYLTREMWMRLRSGD